MTRRFAVLVILATVASLGCSVFTGPSQPPAMPGPGETTALAEPSAPPASSSPSAVTPPSLPSGPLCAEPQPPLVTDLDVRQAPSAPEPSARTPFRDPVFGTCVVRVSDRTTDLSPTDDSPGLKNEYSRVQSFNADGSLVLVRGVEATWYLYDAQTLLPLAELPLEVEPRWDPADPDLLYYLDETRLMVHDVEVGEERLVHEFADDLPGQPLAAVWTRHEGRPSADGRYWGLMAMDEEWETVAFLIYDLNTDRVIANRDMRGVPGAEEGIDHVTISPLANYFLASFDRYCEHGQLGSDAQPCGLMVYDLSLANGRSLLRIVGHYDTALDPEGREAIVFQDIDEDSISLLDLSSGAVAPLRSIDFSHGGTGFHFSGCSFSRPGWALVSTYDGDPGAYTWMEDQVFAIELRPDGRVVRLAHTHSLVDEDQEHDYWAEPQASVNADFTRIVFTSNWGRSGTGEVEMFLIELPADWSQRLP